MSLEEVRRRGAPNKYRLFWRLGACVSFLVYYLGIVWLYVFLRKRIFKNYRALILMYHRIRDDGRDPDISVSRKSFGRQMKYLTNNFEVIPLSALVDQLKDKTNLRNDTVAVTFDDGYKDNFLNAFPILQKYRVKPTIFVVSGSVGKNDEMLNVSEMKLMQKEGIEFGSHTVSHRVLMNVDDGQARKEIANSKVELEYILKDGVTYFAYPKGKKNTHYNETTKCLVREAGYTAAVCTDNGSVDGNSDLFELKRIGIRDFPLFVVKARLSGLFESRPIYFFRTLFRMR